MAKKKGLGKGLQALLPEGYDDISYKSKNQESILQEIDLDLIMPKKGQPRQSLDEEKLNELAASIKEKGLLQPVLVRRLGSRYEIIAGERRWRACLLLGLKRIPAIVRDCSEVEATALSIIENIQREELSPLDEALAYHRLIEEYQLKHEEIAAMVGKSRPYITNMLRLLHLPDGIKQMLQRGEITIGHAKALLTLSDRQVMNELANKTAEEKLSVRALEKIIKEIELSNKEKKDEINKNNKDDQRLLELEEEIKKVWRVKARIAKVRNGYKITLRCREEDVFLTLIHILKENVPRET